MGMASTGVVLVSVAMTIPTLMVLEGMALTNPGEVVSAGYQSEFVSGGYPSEFVSPGYTGELSAVDPSETNSPFFLHPSSLVWLG